MAEQYRIVGVRSNIDRLNAEVVKRLFEDLNYRSAHQGEDWMRLVVPKGKSLKMGRAIATDGPHTEGDEISTSIGIPPISNADGGLPDYPLFRTRGTGMFDPDGPHMIHPAQSAAMRFENREGGTIFAATTKGQPGSTFLLDTFEELTHVALPIEGGRFAERVKRLYADPDPDITQ